MPIPPGPSPTLPLVVAGLIQGLAAKAPCLGTSQSFQLTSSVPKWYRNSKQVRLLENLPTDKMPKKSGIKADEYEGKLRRPGEKREILTTQDGVQQETSSASKESEKGEKLRFF